MPSSKFAGKRPKAPPLLQVEAMKTLTINPTFSDITRINAHVNMIPVEVIMNTGAVTSIADATVVQPQDIIELPQNVRLLGAGKIPLHVIGTTRIILELPDFPLLYHELYVVKNCKYQLLLGVEFDSKHETVFDFSKRKVTLQEKDLPMLGISSDTEDLYESVYCSSNDPKCQFLRISEDIEIPPNTVKLAQTQANIAYEEHQVFHPDQKKLRSLFLLCPSLYIPFKNKMTFQFPLCNPTPNPAQVKKGQILGRLETLGTFYEKEDYIHIIETEEDRTKQDNEELKEMIFDRINKDLSSE